MMSAEEKEDLSLSLKEPQENVERQPLTEEPTVRRKSERVRTLTEKGKELQEEKLKNLQHRYAIVFEKWRYEARLSKVMLRKEASESELSELIDNINITCKDVQTVYEQIREVDTPDADLRRKVDACASLSDFIVNKAMKSLKGEQDEESWPDIGSCLGSDSFKSRSRGSKSSKSQSSSPSIKMLDAEAEAAASQEILAVMEEQEKEAAELQKLERENFEKQQAMEEQRRKIERLEEVKKLNAAKARVRVYNVAENISDSQSLLQSVRAASERQVVHDASCSPLQALNTAQVLNPTSHVFVPLASTFANQAQQNTGTQPRANTSQTLNA